MKPHFLFLLVFIYAAGQSQVPALNATADKQKIVIGEPFRLTLTAVVPAGKPIAWFAVDTLPHFEIQDRSKVDSLLKGELLQLSQTLKITSWDSGQWQIPSFSLPDVKKKTPPIPITVTFSSFDPTQDYHDIKDILEVPRPARTTWYWFLIGALLLALLFLLLFPGKKDKKALAFVPDAGAYKTALAQLSALEKEAASKEAGRFYTELVGIFRTYLKQRKGIESFQKTTDDLCIQLKNVDLPTENFGPLVQTLRMSDLVKFAKFVPAGEENRESIRIIKNAITVIEEKANGIRVAAKY